MDAENRKVLSEAIERYKLALRVYKAECSEYTRIRNSTPPMAFATAEQKLRFLDASEKYKEACRDFTRERSIFNGKRIEIDPTIKAQDLSGSTEAIKQAERDAISEEERLRIMKALGLIKTPVDEAIIIPEDPISRMIERIRRENSVKATTDDLDVPEM